MQDRSLRTAAIVSLAGITLVAHAGPPQTWSFDESTAGEDIFWMSPTAVNPNAASYTGEYVLDSVFLTVSILGEVDVTSLIPARFLSGIGSTDGPAPLVLVDQPFAYPEPPAAPSVSADLSVGLDADGFGILEATNVFLGSITIGIFTVDIQEARVVGEVTITPMGGDDPADLDGDGAVAFGDLLILLSQWGPCRNGPACPADLDGSGDVGFGDLLILLSGWS